MQTPTRHLSPSTASCGPHRLRAAALAGLLAGLVLYAGHAASQTLEPTASGNTPAASTIAAAPHPLTGTWSWTLPGKPCTETWQFRADGTRLATSGEEVTQGDFQIPAQPTAAGFYALSETVTNSNGKRDCSGDLHRAGEESVIRFIQFSPKQDQMIVCKAASLDACFGPFRRVPG